MRCRGFEAEVALILLCRRQQEPDLGRDTDPALLLEHAFPEDAFHRQCGIDQVQLASGTPEDREFRHRLPLFADLAHSSSSRDTRATMTSRAFVKSSLTAGTSSQRSSASPAGAMSPRSQANVTTREAVVTSVRVTWCGRRPRTSMPSASSPWTTFGGTSLSASVPADIASIFTPRSAA